jgi:hypothetical protein
MATPRTEKERLFSAAAELTDPARRAAFLDAGCGEDAALRAEVEDLLRHDEAAGSFLQKPALASSEGRPPGPGAGDICADATEPLGAPAGNDPAATVESPGTGSEARGPSPIAEGPGTWIGPYKLLQPIGNRRAAGVSARPVRASFTISPSRRSAGGQLEQPSDVNSSTSAKGVAVSSSLLGCTFFSSAL